MARFGAILAQVFFFFFFFLYSWKRTFLTQSESELMRDLNSFFFSSFDSMF
jgi:hypothetical protein